LCPDTYITEEVIWLQKKLGKTEDLAQMLKAIIDRSGTSYLKDKAYELYCELLKSGAVERKTAAAVLYILALGIMETIEFSSDLEKISETIRKECSLSKKMSDKLALIFSSLYSETHKKEWKKKDKEGLRAFLKEKFVFNWKGFAVWDAGSCTMDCHYEAEIILMPTEKLSKDKELAKLLEKNPFMTKDDICKLFEKRLGKYLDSEFEDYCTCDDYYPPVVEDFDDNLEYDVTAWCEKNGFEFLSSEGGGDDDGYEPKFYRGR